MACLAARIVLRDQVGCLDWINISTCSSSANRGGIFRTGFPDCIHFWIAVECPADIKCPAEHHFSQSRQKV